ncbi:MAG: ribonuclease R [Magnetovibrio sp.]|nr:ribonuclease R [Magnetovibrio sp.]
MPKKSKAPFPTRDEVLEFIRDNPRDTGKREIARAFGLDAEQKRDLKKLLRELTLDGSLQKGRGRRFSPPGHLPEVMIVQVTGIDEDGDPVAQPMNWEDGETPPTIRMAPERRGQPALGVGDRVLARLTRISDTLYKAKTIRRIAQAPATVLGVFDVVDGTGRVRPTDKRAKAELVVRTGDDLGAAPGDLVRAEVMPGRRLGLRQAKVVERIDNRDDVSAVSLIAIHEQGIPDQFSPDAVAAAEAAGPAPLGQRDDLRKIPLITIDGDDARDFDDAVWAEPDGDPENPAGWHLIVAIADVAWYVRPGSALDRDARTRGNSVYFPDRVVPMLPEALSNGWCSLVPNEDRPCLAAHLWIDANGHLRRHTFTRALMRSAARLTYSQVQAARDGNPDDATGPLMETVIEPLYGAFGSLLRYRQERHALELELPERQVVVGEDGRVESIRERERLDSHKLIEEFMVTANIAAAEALERKRVPCMYRVHDQPSREKIAALSEFLATIGLRFAKGQVPTPLQFNNILSKVADTPETHMVNGIILRSQAQAEYSPRNIGHFGLALRHYAHFTSPIRRYADLLVHRALISSHGLGDGGLPREPDDYVDLGEHLSGTERRAAAAERSAVDRFTAAYLGAQVGTDFAARVNGVTRAGLFVTLSETGAGGLVPIRTLPDDYYIHDERAHALIGETHGLKFHLGQSLSVRLMEAVPITGGLIFAVTDGGERTDGRRKPSGRRGGPKRGARRGTRRTKGRAGRRR